MDHLPVTRRFLFGCRLDASHGDVRYKSSYLFGTAVLVLALAGCRENTESTEKPLDRSSRQLSSTSEVTRAAIAEASRPHSIDLETRERWFVTEYTSMANSDRFRGPLIVDPATGRLARRALVCDAADCPSRSSELSDRLFSYRYPGAYATGDGMVEWTGTPEDFPRVCPWCRRAADVRPHFEGEVAIRRQELEHELQAAQVAWSKARREKQRRPTDYRSPTEIARELSELPAVYLVE